MADADVVGSPPADALEIVEALNRVLGSRAFRRAPRARDFLAYVVTETAAGRGDRLSQRTVGRHALDRAGDFDDRVDSSVRVQANRVRRSLEAYYADEGASDGLRIELLPGRYAPTFVRVPDAGRAPRPTSADGEADADATVVLLAFPPTADDRADLIAGAVCESLAQAMRSFPGIRVVGPTTARADGLAGIGQELGGRFVLQGSVLPRADVVRITVRLSDVVLGDVLWSGGHEVDRATLDGFDADTEWAMGIAAELGDYVGVVQRRSLRSPSTDDRSLEFAARLAFHTYVEGGNPETLMAAEQALAAAMEAGASSPALLAMRGTTLAVLGTYNLSEDREADLTAAADLAKAALAQDPGSGHAHVVLGTVALARHQWDQAIAHSKDAEAATPYHPTVLATAGSLIAYAGEWDTGIRMLQRALRLNPQHPGYMHTLLAQDRLMADDSAGALAEASLIDAPGGVWGPLFRAMALDRLGHRDQAVIEFRTALGIDPTVASDPAALFTAYAALDETPLRALVSTVESLAAATRSSSTA